MTQTYTTSTITLFLICFGGTNGPEYEITAQYTMPQIEQRSFATSFTVGSKGNSVLQLPKNVFDYKSFTVHMKLNFAQDMASGTNNMYFDAYPKLYLFRNGTNHIVSWYDSAQRTIGFNKCPNQEEFEVTVTRDYISPTEVVTKIYYDGVFIKSYTSTSEPSMFMNNQKGDFIKLNGWGDMYKPNNCIKTLSFYNRALTDKEVSELTSKRFSITKEGNLTTRILIEKNGFIPSDAVHIPLDSDSSDRNQIIKASEDVNTVYENGSVWIGSPATNEILKPDWSDTSGYTGFILTQFDEPMSPTGRGVKFQANDESINTAGRLSPKTNASANSGNHTFSVYAKGEGLTIGKAVRVYTGVSWYGNDGDMRLTNQYKKFTFTDLPYGTASGGFGIGVGSPSWELGDVIYLHTPFLEARPFVSPVTIGNRGASSLEFNLNRDYGLDWSKDWSIVYWKRPIATHSNAFTGYNLDSLGSNSNSVGGGYIWWGKSSGSNIISQSTPSAIIPSEYFGNWRMVSLTKTGSTLTIREWDKNGTIYVRTEGTTTSIANYYVNQYGYDFKLGGYDNGNPMNSYYKDLIVAKREFSLTELGALFKSRMKSYKDRVQLSGTVSEGAML